MRYFTTTNSSQILTIFGLLLLLSISSRASLVECDTETLMRSEAEEDCGLVTKNGATCTLDPKRCESDRLVVRSFTCHTGRWFWSSPPVFCEQFASICQWDEVKNTLDCDYESAPINATYRAFRQLDPRLEDVRIVNFPQLEFYRSTFAGLEASIVRLNISGNANADYSWGTLTGLSLLKSLDLSNNNLTQLVPYSLAPFGRLSYLDLRNNPRLQDTPLDPFTLHAAVETCQPLQSANPRTLLMDDDFCTLEDHRGVQPNTVCTLLVCKSHTDHKLACPLPHGADVEDDVIYNTTYISPSQLCNGVGDCPLASDEETNSCETKILRDLVSEPQARPECQATQHMLGETLQMRPGLVVMPLEKTNTILSDIVPVIVWRRSSVMAGEWQLVNHDGSRIIAQLILAPEKATLIMNLTAKPQSPIPFTEISCRYDASYKIATTTTKASTILIASSTTAALSEDPPSSASGRQTSAAVGIGVAAAATLIIILFMFHRSRGRHASALDELAPPVPQYIISQVSSVIFVILSPHSDNPLFFQKALF
jgi:hypothetical protein